MDAQQFVDAITLGSIYMLFAIGLSLSWGILNILNLAHGAIFMFGAILSWRLTKNGDGLTLWALLPLVAIAAGTVAVLLERAAFRPIRRRIADLHASELAMLIASVAAAAMLVSIAENVTDNKVVTIPDSVFEVTTHEVLGLRITNIEVLVTVLAIGLSGGVAWFVRTTRHGRALRALAVDPYMSGLLGVSADRLASLTMFVSGAMAGVAGVLLAIDLGAASSHMGDALLLKAFAVIILGGVGSIAGAATGAYTLAFVETAVVTYVSGGLRDAIAFGLILVLLLVRPEGLFAQKAWRRA